MDTTQLLDKVQTAHEPWARAVAGLSAASLEQPMNASGQTAKDLIAHTTWYEREMVEMLDTRRLAGSDWWTEPLDKRNQLIYAANHDRPAAEVLAEAETTYRALLAAVAGADASVLNDPATITDMPADWVPWEVIASNSYEHYPEHTAEILAWQAGGAAAK